MATPPSTPPTSKSPFNRSNNPVELAKDPKFYKFSHQVEKTLASLETVGEWADIPAFLNRLIKCFSDYPQFQTVPHKLLLAKRLAQSLSPTLPTGVHQKALDAYSCIFEYIGPDNLAHELPVYAFGLFPYLSYASLKNKTQLLNLYEKYILTLGQKLRPCSKSLLLAILPGLEEEGNEHFENVFLKSNVFLTIKALFLLDLLCKNVGQAHFFLSIWLAILSSPKVRFPAINFLHRRFPSITSPEDVAFVLGDDSSLMVQAIQASLKDKDYYVKRGILDLLIKFLPLQNEIISSKDLVPLTTSVLNIFLSREMSLNRRVYTWFLGDNEATETSSIHFKKFAKQPIIKALLNMISNSNSNSTEIQKPYIILTSLMDKPELGPVIVQSALVEILEASFARSEASNLQTEILSSLSQFLETLDSIFLWSLLFKLLTDIDLAYENSLWKLRLIQFVLKACITEDEEVNQVHLPGFLFSSLWLIGYQNEQSNLLRSEEEILEILKITSFILTRLPKTIFIAENITSTIEVSTLPNIYGLVKQYYAPTCEQKTEVLENLIPKLRSQELFQTLVLTLQKFIIVYLNQISQNSETIFAKQPFQRGCDLLLQLTSFQLIDLKEHLQCTKSTDVIIQSNKRLFWEYTRFMIQFCLKPVDLKTLDITIVTLVDLVLKKLICYSQTNSGRFLANALDRIWDYLHPTKGESHIRAVELVWILGQIFPLKKIEGYFARRVSNSKSTNKLKEMDNFGWFWKLSIENGREPAKYFSQPLLIIIDALSDETIEVKQTSQTWVRTFLDSYPEIFNVMLEFLLNKEFRRIIVPKMAPSFELVTNSNSHSLDPELDFIAVYETVPDLLQADYLFSTLVNLTKSEGEGFISILKDTSLLEGHCLISEASSQQDVNYLTFFVQVMLSFLVTDLNLVHGTEKSSQNIKLFCTIGQLFRLWLPYIIPDITNYPSYAGLLSQAVVILSLRLGHWIQEGHISPQMEMIYSLSSLQFLQTDCFVKTTPLIWRKALVFCADKKFFPIDCEGQLKVNDFKSKTTSLYLSSLVILAIREPKAERALQCWCESFLIAIPLLCNLNGIQDIVIPVIDSVLEQISLTNSPQDKPILIEFVNQIYSSLCAVLGFKKWQAFSNTNKKSYSMFDRLAIISRNSNQASTDGELGQLLAAKIPFLLMSLTQAWSYSVAVPSNDECGSLELKSESLFISRIQTGIIQSFENISSLFHKDFPSSFVEAWLMLSGNETQSESLNSLTLFKIVTKIPSFSITSFFHECLLIAKKIISDYSSGYKANKGSNNRHVRMTDTSIINFLELFLQELPLNENQSLASTWLIFITFYKETLYNLTSQKYLLFSLLKLFDQYSKHAGYAEKISDKKLRREVQDIFQRLLDQLLTVVCKPLEQTTWLRLTSNRNTDEPIPEKPSSEIHYFNKKITVPSDLIHVYQVMSFIGQNILPSLPSHLVEHDKISTFISNLMYYFIGPSLRPIHSCYPIALNMLVCVSSWDHSYRCWKREAWEAFLDADFFDQDLVYFDSWMILLATTLKQEKDKLPDIITRITSTPSNLFSNRDSEALISSIMIRRMSFLIHCNAVDAHVVHLPLIQEKIVELLKMSSPTILQIEIFLCLRVLLCRLSSKHLISFWPVLLTELMQVFQSIPARSSISSGFSSVDHCSPEEQQRANLVLAVCKFLDSLFLFQVEEFQIFQWLFVNETLDFVNHHMFSNHSILDQLGNNPSTKPQEISVKRKPKLKMQKISSLQELQPFFNSISSIVFSSTYYQLPPDIQAIERLILRDFRDNSSDILLTPELDQPVVPATDEPPYKSMEPPLDEGYLFQL